MKYRYKAEDAETSVQTPEQRLCIAVLNRAIIDILSDSSEISRDTAASAMRYFRSNSREGISFLNCCEAVGLDPERLRISIRQALRSNMRIAAKMSGQSVVFSDSGLD